MSDVTTVLKEHPVAAGGILLGVIVLAYMQSRASGGAQSESYHYRGDIAAGIDPNAAAISQAAIAAGTANLGTIAQLVGLQDSNQAALTGTLAQTGAARDVALSQTEAQRTTTLRNIDANLTASLASTDAQRDVSLAGTSANVAIANIQGASQMEASRINAQMARDNLAFQTYNAKLISDNTNFAIQADKDKARAAANTSIVRSLITGAAAFFGL